MKKLYILIISIYLFSNCMAQHVDWMVRADNKYYTSQYMYGSHKIALDNQQNIYYSLHVSDTGIFNGDTLTTGSLDFDNEYFYKFNRNGEKQWRKDFIAVFQSSYYGSSVDIQDYVAIDSEIVIAGNYFGGFKLDGQTHKDVNRTSKSFLLKLNDKGDILNMASGLDLGFVTQIMKGKNNEYVIAGYFSGMLKLKDTIFYSESIPKDPSDSFINFYVLRLDTAFKFKKIHLIKGGNDLSNGGYLNSIHLNNNYEFTLAITFKDSLMPYNQWIKPVKYMDVCILNESYDFTNSWIKLIPYTNSASVTRDDEDNIYFSASTYQDTISLDNVIDIPKAKGNRAIFVKLNSTGEAQWIKSASSNKYVCSSVKPILTPDNNIIWIASFPDSTYLEDSILTIKDVEKYYYSNSFFNTYTKDGKLIRSGRANGTNFSAVSDIKMGHEDTMYITGNYIRDLLLGDTVLVDHKYKSGWEDYILKLYYDEQTSTYVAPNESSNTYTIKLFPNPSKKEITIDDLTGVGKIEIFNMEGRLVKTINYQNKQLELNISDLEKGTYILNINGDVKESIEFIKY